MAANYVLLEKVTVGAAGAASVTFSSIPQTGYTDLKVVLSSRQTAGGAWEGILITLNGLTTNQTFKRIYSANSGTPASDSGTGFLSSQSSSYTANTFASTEFYIPNYTSANYKCISANGATENNASGNLMGLTAFLWSSTAAITSISLAGDSSNFAQYTTAYLYGVAKLGTTPAISPYATGGDTIMTDGSYWYHTFISSGTFTPAKALTADYLVVAGGGGSGLHDGGTGAGGAGGLRCTVTATGGGGTLESALSLGTSAYTVTVGAGGAGGISSVAQGSQGGSSVFSTITATGGGGGAGGGGSAAAGGNGGSGGGGAYGAGAGGTRTANQGYAGGVGAAQSNAHGGGGGGGAGAVGSIGTTSVGGNGGAGVATSITGSSVTYAGGGGGGVQSTSYTGGTGGTGGGGRGYGSAGAAVNGTANLGGGAGGSQYIYGSPAQVNGGSGIVVVRYAV